MLLAWFGNRAIQEWRLTSVLLAERRSNEAVELLQGALSRDMSGVQQFVLTDPQWQQFARYRDPMLTSSFWERVTGDRATL